MKPGDERRTGLSRAELTAIPEIFAAKHAEVFVDYNTPQTDPNQNKADSDEDDEDWEAALEGDCYFPKDGYNYEQHLRRVTGASKKGGGGVGVVLEVPEYLKVPEEVFKTQPAETQEQADLLRALDAADEYEELEEGGLEELLPGGCLDDKTILWGPKAAEEADLPDLAQFKAMHAARKAMMGDGEGDEEDESPDKASGGLAAPASRVSAAAFEEFFAAEYADEDDIGAIEEQEIEGEIELDDELLDEYLNDKKVENDKLRSLCEPIKGKYDNVPRVIEETKALIEKHYAMVPENEEDETSSGESEDESRTWDCESVLSTLSNVSNRPSKIGKVKLIKKPAHAMRPLKEGNENESSSESEAEDEVVELPDVVTVRPANETPEEKKARKSGVKAMRKICRQMKKESKQTYKDEASKLTAKQGGTGDVRHKARTFRL